MFSKVKEYFFKKFLAKFVLKQIDKLLAKLPGNESKTAVGLLIIILGYALHSLPNFSEYLQPVLDYLKSLPSDEITGAGIVTFVLGLIHKFTKVGIISAGMTPSAPVVKVAKVISKDGK